MIGLIKFTILNDLINHNNPLKDEIIRSLRAAHDHLDDNAKFYLSEFEKQAKEIAMESKAEAEAAKQYVVETLGWDAIEKTKLLNQARDGQ